MYEVDEDNATYTKYDLRPGLRHGYVGRTETRGIDQAQQDLSRVDSTLSKAGETAEKSGRQIQTKTEAEENGIAITMQGELAANQWTDAMAGAGDQILAAIPLQEKWTSGQEALVAKQKEWLAGLSQLPNANVSAKPTHPWPSRAGRESGRTEDDSMAHDPRYNPSGGESWGHYYQVAVNLAKNGRTERERKLCRERAIRAAHKLGIPVPSFAGGTPFAPGGMALVGEMGPELVNLPRGSQVIPNPQLGSEVTVNVTVEGSVVAERDLAQRLRQELIRTSRRTVDLGFN